MSYDFDGVNDLISLSGTVSGSRTFTVFVWIKPDNAGESGLGTIFAQGNTTARWQFGLYNLGGGIRLRLNTDWPTTDGSWGSPIASIATAWQSACVTYDGNSTANDPVFYIDGALVATTQFTGPAGSFSADAQQGFIGGQSDGNRVFDGLIGEMAMWTTVLSAVEIAAIHVLGINAIPGYTIYAPLDGGKTQEFTGYTLTVSGAVAGENPPTRPAMRRG